MCQSISFFGPSKKPSRETWTKRITFLIASSPAVAKASGATEFALLVPEGGSRPREADGFVRRRLRALLLKQDKRVAFGFSIEINKRWPNAFFANAGLFALHTAWQSARQSR